MKLKAHLQNISEISATIDSEKLERLNNKALIAIAFNRRYKTNHENFEVTEIKIESYMYRVYMLDGTCGLLSDKYLIEVQQEVEEDLDRF